MIAVKDKIEATTECIYGDAIFYGEKPAKWYTSLEDARDDLGV